jgi:hypothetical protein
MFILKRYLKYSKNILRVKQWSKGACVVPNNVVGPRGIIKKPLTNKIYEK